MCPRLLSRLAAPMLAALLLLAAGPLAAAPAPLDELEEEHLLSTEFATPHTPWARPYAGGRLRTLFFVNIHYCDTWAREAVELKQRFHLDAQAVWWARIVDSDKEGWHGEARGMARMKRLLGETWNCFVFIGIPVEKLPAEMQYQMLQQVVKGAGLVLVGADDPRILKPANKLPVPAFLESGVPYTGLPFVQTSVLANTTPEQRTNALAAGKMVTPYRVRDGRGIRLPARPAIQYRPGWEIEYDYWQSLVGRAMLWAAHREPKSTLTVTPSAPRFDRAALPAKEAVTITWSGIPAGQATLVLAMRGEDGRQTPWPSRPVAGPEGSLVLPLPTMQTGTYYVDVLLKQEKAVLTWASASFQVTFPRAVKEIVLDKPFAEVGEQVAGKVLVDGAVPLANERVRVDLLDRRNRVLMRFEGPVAEKAYSFAFPAASWLPMLVRVDATLLSGASPVASSYTYFNVTKRNRGQFNFLIWDVPGGPLGPYAEESLARLGTTLHLANGSPSRYVQAFDMAWVPYTTRIMDPHNKETGVSDPFCWNKETQISKYVDGIVAPHKTGRQSGVFVYSLGDEGVTRGSCVDADCLAGFRDYLKQEYGTIAALNLSWGSSYTDFGQANLDPPEDDKALVAKSKGNYPRWFDRQAFQSFNFTRLCKRYVDAFAKIDPQARVGFEGAGTFDEGDDYDLIVRTNGFWSPYPGLGDEIIRSIAPRDFPRSNWMGYTRDADTLLSKYWRMVTRGNDSVWWWRWDGVGRFHGFLAPHLGPYEATRELVKDTQVVRDGLGTLLIRSQMQDDGIAFLYSMPSSYACRVEQGPAYGHYAATHEAWSRTVRELGLQYRYVTDRMLRLGEFRPAQFKVVVLPRAEGLGEAEAEVLRRFVRNGGTLIADVRPGIFDGHCKPRAQGVLDDVFGIKRTEANAKPSLGPAVVGQGAGALKVERLLSDPAVSLAGATAAGAAGQTPLFVTNTFGKGRAVLLNCPISSLPGLWQPEAPRTVDALLSGLFAEAGVRPQVRLVDAKGQRERNVEILRWRSGDATLVGVFREAGQASQARLTLSEPGRVHDLRNRTAVGPTHSVAVDVLPSRATFFALTGAMVPPAKVSVQPATLQQGQVGKVALKTGQTAGMRAVLLTAQTPDGKEADWLRRVVMVPPEGANAALPVALNDPAGTWRIEARELFTNKVTEASVVVR